MLSFISEMPAISGKMQSLSKTHATLSTIAIKFHALTSDTLLRMGGSFVLFYNRTSLFHLPLTSQSWASCIILNYPNDLNVS